MNKKPMVSVVMITYNHEKYIKQAIEGILIQECNFDIELIISNDASSDQTHSKIEQIIKTYKGPISIKYYNHSDNKGMMKNFVWSLNQANGKYIALCEGDDYWTDPYKLQKQVDFLEANPDFVLTSHNAMIINEQNQLIKEKKVNINEEKIYTKEELKKGAFILTLTMCFRNIIKTYPKEVYGVKNGDTFLISLLGNYGKGKFMPEIIPAVYRVHSGGVWSQSNTKDRIETKRNTFLRLHQYYSRIKDNEMSFYFKKKYIALSGNYVEVVHENGNILKIIFQHILNKDSKYKIPSVLYFFGKLFKFKFFKTNLK